MMKTRGYWSTLFMQKKNDAIYLSKQVQEFLPDKKVSKLVGSSMMEMLTYILDINDKLDWIDVIVRDNDNATIISIKYSGIGYNPKKDTDLNSEKIDRLLSISDDIEYSQILGLNNTVITINK